MVACGDARAQSLGFGLQVNCAATTERATLDSTTVECWDRIMNTNVRGPFLLTQVMYGARSFTVDVLEFSSCIESIEVW